MHLKRIEADGTERIVEGVDKMLDWDELESQCMSCRKCALANTRNNVVFGVGSKTAEIMIVGEGPGEQEDIKGEPFVGAAGKLLDDILSIIDLDRTNCYIANIVKCRPPHNRDPLDQEQDACMEHLRNQIALIKPKVLICLGRVAAKRFISPDFRITRDHGYWYDKDGMFMMALYHPSALLRDPSKRPDTFEDIIRLRSMLKKYRIFPHDE